MKSFSVVVAGSEFTQALNILRNAVKDKKPPNLVIYPDPEGIELYVGGATAKVKGKGVLFGQARIPGKWVDKLFEMFKTTPEVTIKQVENHIFFDNIRIACHWDIPDPTEIRIPINAILLDVLALGKQYNKIEIEKAGLLEKYTAAEEEREERAQKALVMLSTLGVKKKDLDSFIDSTITQYIENQELPIRLMTRLLPNKTNFESNHRFVSSDMNDSLFSDADTTAKIQQVTVTNTNEEQSKLDVSQEQVLINYSGPMPYNLLPDTISDLDKYVETNPIAMIFLGPIMYEDILLDDILDDFEIRWDELYVMLEDTEWKNGIMVPRWWKKSPEEFRDTMCAQYFSNCKYYKGELSEEKKQLLALEAFLYIYYDLYS